MHRLCHTRFGRITIALAITAGVSLLAPSAARATCGDYLASTDGSMSADRDMSGHTPGHNPSAPCHGPNCRSDNKLPVAPAPTVKIVVPQWAVCLLHSTQLRRPIGPQPEDADLCRSQYLSDPPLRPPRSL